MAKTEEPKKTKEKPNINVRVTEDIVKGLEKLSIDDTVTFKFNGKITGINRDTWDDDKKISVSAEITSGDIIESKGKGLRERLMDAGKEKEEK
jgi:hypothetical protein